MKEKDKNALERGLGTPPRGLAILTIIGPSLVWAAEYIGSGEVILATRTGAILGPGIMWAVVLGIFLKFWIGMSGARYTVCTGEGMIDMIARMPGPKNWGVWIVLVAQFIGGTIAIGSLASAAGVFLGSMLHIPSYIGGWIVTVFCLTVAWSGGFNILRILMSFMVTIIVIGVLYVAITVLPGVGNILDGFLFKIPAVPDWAAQESRNPWREILPLIGWGAGGFASQVWYTYWIMGAGYGAAHHREYGQAANVKTLRNMSKSVAEKIKGWCNVVYADASLAMVIGIVVTCSFLIAGAGVLGSSQLAPDGEAVAITLSNIFSSKWGKVGGFLFMLSGTAALISTQAGQLAGWPRLLADTFRLCIPAFAKRFAWKSQFRIFLLYFFCTNMLIVFTLGFKPVFLVKMGALLDGLLLTPLQALWVGVGLYVVMPRMLSKEAGAILRPHWIFAVLLIVAFLVFGYFCAYQIPVVLIK